MTWDIAGKFLLALVTIIVGAIQFWPRGGRRARIKSDVELYSLLPEEIENREEFRQHISAQLAQLIKRETVKRRDPIGIVLGIVFTGGGAYLGVLAFKGGWWWFFLVLAIVGVPLGMVMIADALPKAERDDSGRRLKKNRTLKSPDGRD
ncbi:MAG: hypothetical protein HOQ05_04680 [Corynebacteriales bacterium]|nr:hypothetical protein [Mycobacteriales bacterium]